MDKHRVVVGIDLDDTVWEFVKPLLNKYNLWYEDNVCYEDITDWDIHQFLKPECKNVFALCTAGFFDSLHIDKDVVDWLTILNEIADLKFVSACASETVPWRAALLKRELPFFRDDMLIKLYDKSLFKCDYFIDDNEDHCNATDARAFLISRPWNDNKGVTIEHALCRVVINVLKRGGKI